MPLVLLKFPATFAFSVNVLVPLVAITPLASLNVIVGVALYNGHLNVFVPVALSLHTYPSLNVAVTVYPLSFAVV